MKVFFDVVHEELSEQVHQFAEDELRDLVPLLEEGGVLIDDLVRKVARMGWIGVTIPREFGGMGLGHLAKTVIIEELSRVSGAMGAAVQASQLGVAKIVHFGNEDQRKYWLPLIASGDCLPTIAVTELNSGGHVLGMASTAVRDGDSYVLNGHKCFVGNSHIGDVHGVVMRTGPGSRGLSAFLVESSRPGFSLGPMGSQAGLHGFSYGEIRFDDVRVPVANRLGDEGMGLDVAYSSSVLYGRANLTAVALGIHQAVLDETVSFCQARENKNGLLSELPIVAAKIGQIKSNLLTARTVAYHAVTLLDQGESCDAELMNAKLVNPELALNSVRTAMEIFAARGCQRDFHIERYLRDVFHTFPAAGTSDIQRLRLAEITCGTYTRSWSEQLTSTSVDADDAWDAEQA
ncbi:MAG: acyl-CoA dehydrogenase [Actinomycetota bacterium]|jgi:alkylation response protein AidB-like acyl-CoA dehydrogenase|nr:acyl-CoA dehydrogenase [Actinomycetota bacterium]